MSTIPSSAIYLGTFNRKLTAHGDASAEVQYKIAEADWEAMRLFLLRTALSDDTLLGCNDVEEDPLGKDPNNGTILVTAKYIPWMKILWGTVNFPFHGDWEAHAEAFTISGCLFWQSDGTPLMNRQAKPALKVMCRKLVLKGVRSATNLNYTFYNQTSLDALAGCINSDSFLGFSPGQALFETYSGASRPYDDGSMVYDVSANRQWLKRRCAWRVQALAEGDLSERARRRARELVRDYDVRVLPPAEMKSSPTVPTAAGITARQYIRPPLDARLPMPGSKLTKTYKGHLYVVEVLDRGFGYDGEIYRSLSAVAHVITGCHWNGYLFFGIADPRKEQV